MVRTLAPLLLLAPVPLLCPTTEAFLAQPASAWALASRTASRRQLIRRVVMSAKPDGSDAEEPGKIVPPDHLPISYRSDNGTRDDEFYMDEMEKSSLNPYFDVVRRLSPSEHIQRFMRVTPPRVQEAVRNTVMGLLGTLPRHAFETTAISTGDALANLMFQLQMTGYMFKNAEYRLSLQSSLQSLGEAPVAGLLSAAAEKDGSDAESEGKSALPLPLDDNGNIVLKKPKITGKVKLTYENGQEVEVDAGAYMTELATQVEVLQHQLSSKQTQQQEAQRKDLLLYIKDMPPTQLQSLTAGMSPEVLESMKMLVETVMRSMGATTIGRQTLTQQSSNGMAQLCMWQLAVGYSLREMEAREEIRQRFEAAESD
ncbi:hypothetical protein JKP88DRAFT_217690 [Tribonema minus]|uniref:Uncharacterized protein n=1 Tax=Tribonema minus TaxID=303371 RepID=A0A836CKK0_9STRA|nr:hypothetical protein JKP88DRAFT_217690 [Tribonema minus]